MQLQKLATDGDDAIFSLRPGPDGRPLPDQSRLKKAWKAIDSRSDVQIKGEGDEHILLHLPKSTSAEQLRDFLEMLKAS